jgi:hypothetical protein
MNRGFENGVLDAGLREVALQRGTSGTAADDDYVIVCIHKKFALPEAAAGGIPRERDQRPPYQLP